MRLIPQPPALLLSRKTKAPEFGSLKASTRRVLFVPAVEPSRRIVAQPLSEHMEPMRSSVCRRDVMHGREQSGNVREREREGVSMSVHMYM